MGSATDKLRQMLRAHFKQDSAVADSLLELDERLGLDLTSYQHAVLEDWFIRLEAERQGKMVKETSFLEGPYVLVVTNTERPEDDAIVVAPQGGFQTREEAKEYATQFDVEGMTFVIAPLRLPRFFNQYMSW